MDVVELNQNLKNMFVNFIQYYFYFIFPGRREYVVLVSIRNDFFFFFVFEISWVYTFTREKANQFLKVYPLNISVLNCSNAVKVKSINGKLKW